MAGDAAYSRATMSRLFKMRGLFLPVVAREATVSNSLRRSASENKNLAFVATASNVIGPWAMAGLATVRCPAILELEDGIPVARLLQVLEDVIVTCLAVICADKRAALSLLWTFARWACPKRRN